MLIQSLLNTSDLLQRPETVDSTVSATSHSASSPSHPGFAIGEGSRIVDKLSTSTMNISERYADNPPLKTELMSVDEMKTYWQHYGQSRDVTAIAYIDGEPAMMFGKHTTSRNPFSHIASGFNGNPQQTINALRSEYGNRLNVEYFTPNQGPTNAETFALFNGISFDKYVSTQLQNAVASRAAHEQQRLESQQRQLAWDNTQVDAVFTVHDTIIASSAGGTADLHTNNLLTAMDNLGISREEAQALFSDTSGNKSSATSLEQRLASLFGSSLSGDYPGESARQTRKEVSTKAQAQYAQNSRHYG